MNKDKIIIGLAGIILCFVALSWGQLKEEVSLISQEEIVSVAESLQENYFTPLSLQQQAEWHRAFAEKLEEEQKQARELEGAGSDEISFMTRTMHTVVSIPEYTKEELLQIGALIDELFNEEEGHALFRVEIEYGKRQIVTQLLQESVSGKFSEFVHRVSYEVFNGEPVLFVVLNLEHPEESDFYES